MPLVVRRSPPSIARNPRLIDGASSRFDFRFESTSFPRGEEVLGEPKSEIHELLTRRDARWSNRFGVSPDIREFQGFFSLRFQACFPWRKNSGMQEERTVDREQRRPFDTKVPLLLEPLIHDSKYSDARFNFNERSPILSPRYSRNVNNDRAVMNISLALIASTFREQQVSLFARISMEGFEIENFTEHHCTIPTRRKETMRSGRGYLGETKRDERGASEDALRKKNDLFIGVRSGGGSSAATPSLSTRNDLPEHHWNDERFGVTTIRVRCWST